VVGTQEGTIVASVTVKKSDIIQGDEVEFHDGPKIILPRGMTYDKAFKILERLRQEAETPTTFERIFKYRPDDGAHATFWCMKARWGMALGKPLETFFGTIPAETRTINIAFGQTMQVPWGRMEIPTLPGLQVHLASIEDDELGPLFRLVAMGPRKFKDEMHALFNDIQEYLQTNSIYRGKALIGADKMEFMNVDIDRSKIVFSDQVEDMLDGTVWAPIRYADAMRRENIPLKRALLLWGPYGTGKSSAGLLTAHVAAEHGWTFLSAKPGRDKIEDVLRTARLYEPAVVFVEDIDNQSNDADSTAVTKLLDAFDGITAKGGELMIVLTTNHLDRIHKGMLRPGRLDAIVEIAGLDRGGVERLIKAVVPEGKLSPDCDFDEVYAAMDGFLPAFVRETINRAVSFAVARLHGEGNYVIDTPDLVHAATTLRPQLDALEGAGEGVHRPTLDVALSEAVRSELAKVQTWSPEYEEFFGVQVVAENK
jgi:transitional endoplasmic reticulum ATPase